MDKTLPEQTYIHDTGFRQRHRNNSGWIVYTLFYTRCFKECVQIIYKSDVWLTVHRNSVWIRKTNQMSLFVFFISLRIVAQHVSGNHVPIIRS